ncbi:uncharacterized protein SCODWIG_03353 [Saccharomycodes ludwigii]|uniref:DSC E3 ubiquitin ligase complex subunit 3 C-terminal domain-containing protein n=1 Tax=Saccharomycodes ludwigii TaxID=36035 RepID=A0A376BAA6_9ASCO|nr:uncharacterized protein SCODWIG_03353 [Saccharomycodes ludwigii]
MTKYYLVIRFSSGTDRDLKLDITNVPLHNITLPWLRRMCRELHPQSDNNRVDLNKCRLKFIRNGRLLTILNWHEIEIELSQFRHQQQDGNSNSNTKNNNDNNTKEYFIHCLVGPEEPIPINPSTEDQDTIENNNNNNHNDNTNPVIGFDRLRAFGFNDEEIQLLRTQFQNRARRMYGDDRRVGSENDNEDDEDDVYDEDEEGHDTRANNNNNSTDLRELEERWMENTVTDDANQEILSTSNWNTNLSILTGLTIGFLLGIFGILLLLICDTSGTNGLLNPISGRRNLNRTVKFSIVAGFISNLIFGLGAKL